MVAVRVLLLKKKNKKNLGPKMAMLADTQWKGYSIKVRLWIMAKGCLPATFPERPDGSLAIQGLTGDTFSFGPSLCALGILD